MSRLGGDSTALGVLKRQRDVDLPRLGQSQAAPIRTTTPIAMSRPTTILAASGPNGDGPLSECEWKCECATRTG